MRTPKRRPYRRLSALLPLALGIVVLPACGEDTTRTTPVGSGMAATPSAPSTSPTAANEASPRPAYAVMTNVGSPEGDVSYLATLDSLEAGSVLDLDQAIEFPGARAILGISGHPAVWVTSWDEPTIERWDLRADGSFERGPIVSFAGLGVSNTGYVSLTRAFTLERSAFYSSEIGALIQWNPTTMEIIGELPLDIPDNELPDGAIPGKSAIPPSDGWVQLRPDGTVVVNYYYLDGDFVLGDRVGLRVVDWVNNQVIGSDEWVGCNYLGRGSQTSDGAIYYTALAQWVQDNLIWPGEATTAVPCALRVLPGQTTFDRSFQPNDLGQLIGGKTVTGSLEILNDRRSYFVGWDDALVTQPLTVDNYEDMRYSTPAWRWYTWDLRSPRATAIDAEPFASQPDILWADGRALFRDQTLTSEQGGGGVTPMYELTSDGTLVPAFIGRGTVDSIVKLAN
jgi:hypothetical protein